MNLFRVPRTFLNVGVTVALFASPWVTLLLAWFLLARHSISALWTVSALAGAASVVAYFRCSDYPVRAMRARRILEMEQPVLFALVAELSTAARIPMPRLYLSPAPAPNAFATGRSPKTAIVCCTQGLVDTLTERELRAVLAHELMHVKYRDTLACSLVGTLTGLIAGLSGLFVVNRNYAKVMDRAVTGGAVILAPVAAMCVQIAVSRARELRADDEAVKLTGDPLGLALALRKLQSGADTSPLPATSQFRAVAYLMTAQPFRSAPVRIFNSHPPIKLRIGRLERAAFNRFTGNKNPNY